jgi:hypothetical protein
MDLYFKITEPIHRSSRIRATNLELNSRFSSSNGTKHLLVSGTTDTTTTLSWTASADNLAVTGYEIYKEQL